VITPFADRLLPMLSDLFVEMNFSEAILKDLKEESKKQRKQKKN